MTTNQCVARSALISASITGKMETITTKSIVDTAELENESKRDMQKMKDANISNRELREGEQI